MLKGCTPLLQNTSHYHSLFSSEEGVTPLLHNKVSTNQEQNPIVVEMHLLLANHHIYDICTLHQ